MKIYISNELGCAYRLNNDRLEYAPLYRVGRVFDTEDFTFVEPDLVGEENVTFNGVDTNLYGVFATVTRILKDKTA